MQASQSTPSNLYDFLSYHSTYSGQRGAPCSCAVSISPQGGYIFRYECAIYFTHLLTLFFTIYGYTATETRKRAWKMKGKDPHAVTSDRPPGWIGLRRSHSAACPLVCPPVTERPDTPAGHHAARGT